VHGHARTAQLLASGFLVLTKNALYLRLQKEGPFDCWKRPNRRPERKPCNVGPKSYFRNVAQRGANVPHY